MTDLYSAHLQHLSQVFESALAEHGYDKLVIGSGSERYRFVDDTRYPYRANPYFVQWLPLTEYPECWLIVTPGEKPELLFYQPDDFWHLVQPVPAGDWQDHIKVTVYRQREELDRLLPILDSKVAVIAEQLPEHWQLAQNPQPLLNQLNYHRAVKTDWEQQNLREANYLAVRGHQTAQELFYQGASEYQIQQGYLQAICHNERDMSYDNIVALNEHSAVLHYQFQQRVAPAEHRTLLVDAGAVMNGYGADITRTCSQQGSAFAGLIEALDQQHLKLISQIKAGVSNVDLHLKMHHLIAEVLQQADIVNVAPEQQLEQGLTSIFFPHGLGHLLGLQVHDLGGRQIDPLGTIQEPPEGHPFLRLTRKLEEGYVITIEPGLYFIPSLLEQALQDDRKQLINWERVEQMLPFGGIRIEDNICVTASGVENYTRDGFARLAAE